MIEAIAYLTVGPMGMLTALVVGTFFGFIAGLTPGLGGRISIILCLPIAVLWDPIGGAIFLFSMHAVIHTATSIPAIAFALPSTSADAATIIDGHPLAKMGRGGEALGASLSASALGGAIGALAFLVSIPIARSLLAWFGPPEFLVLAIAGLSMVVTLSGRNIMTGLLVGLLGLLLSMVGRDVTISASRFTFGVPELQDGISMAAFVGGIFVVPEMLARFEIEGDSKKLAIRTSLEDVFKGLWTTFRYMPLVLRSSLYGIVVGIMPGVGSSVSVWMSYAYAARTVKSKIPFGQGAIAGVIAPEAANNSKEGGAMVPTLFFGIPGSSSMAMMLIALQVVGLHIGPTLLTTEVKTSIILATTVLLSNLIAIPFFFAAVPSIIRLTTLRRDHLTAIAIAFSLFAALMQSMSSVTLLQFALGGLAGIILKWIGWSRSPFLLGFVLGPIAEISYIQTSQIWGWAMFLRPLTLVMAVGFGFSIVRALTHRKPTIQTSLGIPDAFLAFAIFCIFASGFLMTVRFPVGASPFPLIITSAGGILSAFTAGWALFSPKERKPLEQFHWLWESTVYCAAVPVIGLPLASIVYVFYILRRQKVKFGVALGSALLLGILITGMLTLVFDLRAERLIQGEIIWQLQNRN